MASVAATTGVARRPTAPRATTWRAPALGGSVAALLTAYTAWQDPNADGVFPQCPTYSVFGVDCPGCGGLRAVHALTHGDLVAAADHNLVAVIVLPVLVVAWAIWLLRTCGVATPPVPRLRGTGWLAVGLTLVAFTIVRNLGGVAAFEYLAATA